MEHAPRARHRRLMNHSTPQVAPAVLTFAQLLLSSTRRGARLARLLTAEQLREWPVSHGVTERAEQIVAELAANAALHGRVGSRLFRLTLTLDTTAGLLRIAVTDARGECLPLPPADDVTSLDAESGRGLLLVTVLADRWASSPIPLGARQCGPSVTGRGPARATHTRRQVRRDRTETASPTRREGRGREAAMNAPAVSVPVEPHHADERPYGRDAVLEPAAWRQLVQGAP